ncbi:MAG: Ig-like domain-containing protein [Gemmatimonadales bacterium]
MSRIRLAGFGLLTTLAACIGGEPQVGSVTVNLTTVSMDAIGRTQQLSATVRDQDGELMEGQTISWSSSAPGVATISEAGLVTGVSNGSSSVTATAGSQSSPATTVTVQQVATTLTATAGNNQTGPVGAALPTALQVAAADALGQPANGVSVAFAVTAGGGTLSTATVTTAAGVASTNWTLGTVAGAAQGVAATVGSASASFAATSTPGAPDSLVIVSGDDQTSSAASELPDSLRVRVADAFGNPVTGVNVTWAVTSGGGSIDPTANTTDADGEAAASWTLGGLGPQTATATVTGVTVGSPAQFSAEAVAGSVAIHHGDGQTGLAGAAVNDRPAVRVTAGTTPLAGLTVDFVVETGGGSATGGTAVTDADGVARVGSWILGATPGANTLSATVNGAGFTNNPVTFTATGQAAAYNIEIRYINGTTPTAAQQAAFDSAEARWERIIFRDEADIALNVPADACIVGQPALNETVDDLIIWVEFAAMDGAGARLAEAGHCDSDPPIRAATTGLPILGIMRIDNADIGAMEADGSLDEVVMHEMGHVLGFNGRIFGQKGRLKNPSLSLGAGVDTHFDGPFAITQMNANGGNGYTGAKVPLENTAVPGSADSHWRESVYDAELMTPFTEGGNPMPLGVVTIAALRDIGYGVNYSAAEPHMLGFGLRATGGQKTLLVNDVIFVNLSGSGATWRPVR